MDLKPSPFAPDRFPDLPAIAGVLSSTQRLGVYNDVNLRMKLLVATFPDGASAGGVFTRSATRSADVDWCREALDTGNGRATALIVNSGNSNAFTGSAGIAKNEASLDAMSGLIGTDRTSIFLAATGVIGEPLPARVVADNLPAGVEQLGAPNWEANARAIMTTDTFPKGSGGTCTIGETTVSVSGICKGSGMIAPNMATMLAYVFTDANLSSAVCQALVSKHVDTTFNCVTVDSDTSTSDTLMLFATGKADHPLIDDPADPRLADFSRLIGEVFHDLATQLVKDGEGATKFIEIEVTGADTNTAAKSIAASVANSPLFKTAMAADDANWGRIVMAVGKSGEMVDRDQLRIAFSSEASGSHEVARDGMRSPGYSEALASEIVSSPEIKISISVGPGPGHATVWTCDLTHGYVDINGAYRT